MTRNAQYRWTLAMLLVLYPWTAHSQDSTRPGTIDVVLNPSYGTELDGKSVMVSVLRDGQVLKQAEIVVRDRSYDSETFHLPPGRYDVRMEGEGMQAIIKQGITVLPGEKTKLAQLMVKGSGLKTVTYSDIGTLESLIARVEKLEAALAELKRLPR